MSRVHTAATRPYTVLLASRIASSRSWNVVIPITGPKISSWAIRASGRIWSNTVGAMK